MISIWKKIVLLIAVSVVFVSCKESEQTLDLGSSGDYRQYIGQKIRVTQNGKVGIGSHPRHGFMLVSVSYIDEAYVGDKLTKLEHGYYVCDSLGGTPTFVFSQGDTLEIRGVEKHKRRIDGSDFNRSYYRWGAPQFKVEFKDKATSFTYEFFVPTSFLLEKSSFNSRLELSP